MRTSKRIFSSGVPAFSEEASGVGAGPPRDTRAWRKADARLPGSSARTFIPSSLGSPLFPAPPNSAAIATILSAVAFRCEARAVILISLAKTGAGNAAFAAFSRDAVNCARIDASSAPASGVFAFPWRAMMTPIPKRTLSNARAAKMMANLRPRTPARCCLATSSAVPTASRDPLPCLWISRAIASSRCSRESPAISCSKRSRSAFGRLPSR